MSPRDFLRRRRGSAGPRRRSDRADGACSTRHVCPQSAQQKVVTFARLYAADVSSDPQSGHEGSATRMPRSVHRADRSRRRTSLAASRAALSNRRSPRDV
ncbi:MAG: hypothetical protein AUI11_06070 [Acidobacteria bacterium 13_2_20CM_2_66_4]|nr:MAG: hypothetical protein AUI11_06070 [Acidobacteria bacterium 13_2_20CM_2_66_4]